MIGYKLLREDGRSLSDGHGAVAYDLTGAWQEVPGNGSYLGLTVPGLLRGGFGPLLAEVEYEAPTGEVDDGEVITARRVMVVRTATIDRWTLVRVACKAARLVAHHSSDPRVMAAIEAAEQCERERTPAAAAAAAAYAAYATAAARAAYAAADAAYAAADAAYAADAASDAADAAYAAYAAAADATAILGYLVEDAWGTP